MRTQRGYYLISDRRNNPTRTNFINQGTIRGFTLLELMIVMVIVAIGVALAVPSYQDILERRHTTAQAEELAAFLAYAQSEAVKTNKMVSVELTHTSPNHWCIGANEGDAGCNCTGDDSNNLCLLNGVTKTMDSSTQAKSSMSDYSADTTFVFDPVRGTMISVDLGPDHFFKVESDNGNWALEVNIGPTGRIRICNPDSDKEVPGFKPCPS